MHNAVSISRFNRILNAADVIFDPASSEFIGTTIPYNPFGDYRVPIASNTPSIDFATVHPKEVDISKLATIDFSIYTTQLFKLPAGGVGFVLGGQFRRESLSQDPDLLALDRDLFGESTLALVTTTRFPAPPSLLHLLTVAERSSRCTRRLASRFLAQKTP